MTAEQTSKVENNTQAERSTLVETKLTKLQQVIYGAMLGTGGLFSLTVITDFMTGTKASEAIKSFAGSLPPGYIQFVLRNIAISPLTSKTATGVGLTRLAIWLDRKFHEQNRRKSGEQKTQP